MANATEAQQDAATLKARLQRANTDYQTFEEAERDGWVRLKRIADVIPELITSTVLDIQDAGAGGRGGYGSHGYEFHLLYQDRVVARTETVRAAMATNAIGRRGAFLPMFRRDELARCLHLAHDCAQ